MGGLKAINAQTEEASGVAILEFKQGFLGWFEGVKPLQTNPSPSPSKERGNTGGEVANKDERY